MANEYTLYSGLGISTETVVERVLVQLEEKGHGINCRGKDENLVSKTCGLILPKELIKGLLTYSVGSTKNGSYYKTVISPVFMSKKVKILSNESLSTRVQDYGFLEDCLPEKITHESFNGDIQ